jgi:hypothetical protein
MSRHSTSSSSSSLPRPQDIAYASLLSLDSSPRPFKSPVDDVVAAATPIERAHEIIDSAWAMEEQGNLGGACER